MTDLALIYHLSKSKCYSCVWTCVDAINTHIPIHFPIDDPEKLAILAAEFQAKSRGQCWSGQVGAVDGVHIAMGKPSKKYTTLVATSSLGKTSSPS